MGSPVLHFEIHAANPERALAFYEQVLGWGHNSVPGMEQQYWLLFPLGEPPREGQAPPAGINGGMMMRQGDAPEDGQAVNAYVCVVEVDDLDATHDAFVHHGGAIAVPPMEIPGVGRVFYGKDTEGNIVGVMQPAPSDMAQAA